MPKQKRNSIISHNFKSNNVYTNYKFHRKGKILKLIHEFKYNYHKKFSDFFAEKMSVNYIRQKMLEISYSRLFIGKRKNKYVPVFNN